MSIAANPYSTSVPIATGERLHTRVDFRRYFEAGGIDVAQPDVSHAGSITETKRIADMAATYDVALAPHCPIGCARILLAGDGDRPQCPDSRTDPLSRGRLRAIR